MTEKYNKDGSVSLDGSGVKILRMLDPQGEPDVIECDGRRYVPEQRYQQLAGITRDLWQFIADRAPNMPQSIYILGKTAEQLEKLGVMVDD